MLPFVCLFFLHFSNLVTGGPYSYVDLSHNVTIGMPVWFGLSPYRMNVSIEPNLGDYMIQTETIEFPSHVGTHICAPVHLMSNGLTVDQILEETLQGPAVVVDVTSKTSNDPNYAVTVEDFQNFEAANGPIPTGSIVLIRTGWSQYWSDVTKYLGTDDPIDHTKARHPGLCGKAAAWLVKERNIPGVGMDTASLDPGVNIDFGAFKAIFGANKYVILNLANLDKLPATGVMLHALPIKLKGASGAPAKVVAFV